MTDEEAEIARLRGVVEAVQALVDDMEAQAAESTPVMGEVWTVAAREVRRVLAPVSSSGEAESGESDGLREKFRVERLTPSSRGIDHSACRYFVLDPQHDPHAVTALRAYADACEADEPALAADLREWATPAPVLSGGSDKCASEAVTVEGTSNAGGQADGEGEARRRSTVYARAVAGSLDAQTVGALARGFHDGYLAAARPVLSREALARIIEPDAWSLSDLEWHDDYGRTTSVTRSLDERGYVRQSALNRAGKILTVLYPEDGE